MINLKREIVNQLCYGQLSVETLQLLLVIIQENVPELSAFEHQKGECVTNNEVLSTVFVKQNLPDVGADRFAFYLPYNDFSEIVFAAQQYLLKQKATV